jgi:hypothetical protein
MGRRRSILYRAEIGRSGRKAGIRRLQRSEKAPCKVLNFKTNKNSRAPPSDLGSEGVTDAQRGGIFAAPECIQRRRIDAG